MLLAGKKQKNESHKAQIASNDYLRMGPGRSLRKLACKYNEETTNSVPTRNFRIIAKWSTNYGWVKRAEEYDARMENKKTEYAQRMMEEGLAADYERVGKLKTLFDLLYGELFEEGEEGALHNLWVPDVKKIGAGEYSETVEIERYNSSLISDIRGLLDDLAKETGGRKQKQEHEFTNQLEITLTGNINPDEI